SEARNPKEIRMNEGTNPKPSGFNAAISGKSEIRISKSETIPNDQRGKSKAVRFGGTDLRVCPTRSRLHQAAPEDAGEHRRWKATRPTFRFCRVQLHRSQ